MKRFTTRMPDFRAVQWTGDNLSDFKFLEEAPFKRKLRIDDKNTLWIEGSKYLTLRTKDWLKIYDDDSIDDEPYQSFGRFIELKPNHVVQTDLTELVMEDGKKMYMIFTLYNGEKYACPAQSLILHNGPLKVEGAEMVDLKD